jgi:hypothetical protein
MKEERRDSVRLAPYVKLEPLYRDQMVDCRLFLLGDRYRQLIRTYNEVVYRMSRKGDPMTIAAEVLESAEVRQYYDVSVADGCVKLTLHDAVFREPYPLRSEDFALRITAGSRTMTLPLPLERLRPLGTLLPLLAGNDGDVEIGVELGLEPGRTGVVSRSFCQIGCEWLH